MQHKGNFKLAIRERFSNHYFVFPFTHTQTEINRAIIAIPHNTSFPAEISLSGAGNQAYLYPSLVRICNPYPSRHDWKLVLIFFSLSPKPNQR